MDKIFKIKRKSLKMLENRWISFPIILEWGKPQFDIKKKYKNDKLEKYSHYP